MTLNQIYHSFYVKNGSVSKKKFHMLFQPSHILLVKTKSRNFPQWNKSSIVRFHIPFHVIHGSAMLFHHKRNDGNYVHALHGHNQQTENYITMIPVESALSGVTPTDRRNHTHVCLKKNINWKRSDKMNPKRSDKMQPTLIKAMKWNLRISKRWDESQKQTIKWKQTISIFKLYNKIKVFASSSFTWKLNQYWTKQNQLVSRRGLNRRGLLFYNYGRFNPNVLRHVKQWSLFNSTPGRFSLCEARRWNIIQKNRQASPISNKWQQNYYYQQWNRNKAFSCGIIDKLRLSVKIMIKSALKGILLVNFPEKEKDFLIKNLAAENKIPLITQSASLLLKDSRNMNDLLGVDDPIQSLFDKVKTSVPCICVRADYTI